MQEFKKGTNTKLIINSATSIDSSALTVERLSLDNPQQFEETEGEFETVAEGVYTVNVKFPEMGTFLYRVKRENEVLEIYKVKVVETTENDLIKEQLNMIHESIQNLYSENEDDSDDILKKLNKIEKIISFINGRI